MPDSVPVQPQPAHIVCTSVQRELVPTLRSLHLDQAAVAVFRLLDGFADLVFVNRRLEVQFLSPAPTIQRFAILQQLKGNTKGNTRRPAHS